MTDPTTPDNLRYRLPLAAGVAGLVKDAINSNTGGLRDTITAIARANVGTSPFVRANSDGTWPDMSDRRPGITLMWLRELSPSILAPMPTDTVGYLVGDPVYPLQGGTSLNLSVTSTGTSAKMSWRNDGSNTVGWTIGRDGYDATGYGEWSGPVPATDSSATFYNLVPGSMYTFTLTNRATGVKESVRYTMPTTEQPTPGTGPTSGVPYPDTVYPDTAYPA